MDPTNLGELFHSLKVELIRHRYAFALAFIFISGLILTAGYQLPKTYSSRVVLYADVTNIIGSLLEGKAEITKIDRAKEARDTIFTDRILRKVAVTSGIKNPENAVLMLRTRMKISANGDYVNISYQSSGRDESFNVIDAVTQAFLSETSRKKREESQSAFEFIDEQVKSYKSQLEAAERSLEEFSARNIDVTEQSVANRVIRYKDSIQLLKLEIQDSEARISSFTAQLAEESEFLQIEEEPEITFDQRQLENFERQISDLRLSYLDTHPDIVSLNDQITILEGKVAQQKEESKGVKHFSQIENPAFTNIKEVLNSEKAEYTVRKKRLANTEKLLAVELSNARTVASKQATYQELTRDYKVTTDVYEDMLKRRESARLSMTLDIQGQGVTYKIHEPASYPLKSNGLQLIHYAMIGPLLGIFVPFGMIIILILMDAKVRSASFMSDNLPPNIRLITSIPMYNSAVAEFASKRSLILLAAAIALYMAVFGILSTGTETLIALGFPAAL